MVKGIKGEKIDTNILKEDKINLPEEDEFFEASELIETEE